MTFSGRSEWELVRRTLSEKTDLTQRMLVALGELEGDSLDFVEIVMSLEEKYKIKIPLPN